MHYRCKVKRRCPYIGKHLMSNNIKCKKKKKKFSNCPLSNCSSIKSDIKELRIYLRRQHEIYRKQKIATILLIFCSLYTVYRFKPSLNINHMLLIIMQQHM